MCRLVEFEQPKRMLIFCNTKRQVDDLAAKMKARGQEMLALHGDLNQQQRDLVMKQFEPIIKHSMYIFKTTIPRSTAVNQAQLAGVPLLYYMKNNPTRIGYSLFCDELLSREEI